MKDILVHDLRVQGQTVPGHYAKFDVDATTPLSYFVTRTLQEAAAYNDDARLIILAHGMEYPTLGGGFGIAFLPRGPDAQYDRPACAIARAYSWRNHPA